MPMPGAGSQLDRIEHKIDQLTRYDHILRRLEGMQHELERIKDEIARMVEALKKKAVDLGIVFGPTPRTTTERGTEMANAKKATGKDIKCPCLKPKGGKVGAVMPDVALTDPLPKSITLQPLDINGQPVTLSPSDQVTGTLTSDSPNFTVAPGADATHFVGTVPANTPQGSVANLAATLKGTIAGAQADLTASVKVTIDVAPNPVAVDMAIIFAS